MKKVLALILAASLFGPATHHDLKGYALNKARITFAQTCDKITQELITDRLKDSEAYQKITGREFALCGSTGVPKSKRGLLKDLEVANDELFEAIKRTGTGEGDTERGLLGILKWRYSRSL